MAFIPWRLAKVQPPLKNCLEVPPGATSGRRIDLTRRLAGGLGLKAIDLGCSKVVRPGTLLTKRMGTPAYFAPEVFLRSYDTSADLWSAGILVGLPPCGYHHAVCNCAVSLRVPPVAFVFTLLYSPCGLLGLSAVDWAFSPLAKPEGTHYSRRDGLCRKQEGRVSV